MVRCGIARYDTLGGGGVSEDTQSDKASDSREVVHFASSNKQSVFWLQLQDVEMLVGVNPSTYISK